MTVSPAEDSAYGDSGAGWTPFRAWVRTGGSTLIERSTERKALQGGAGNGQAVTAGCDVLIATSATARATTRGV